MKNIHKKKEGEHCVIYMFLYFNYPSYIVVHVVIIHFFHSIFFKYVTIYVIGYNIVLGLYFFQT